MLNIIIAGMWTIANDHQIV